jgi:hypothetical protein
VFWLVLVNPIVVIAASAIGVIACRGAGANPHLHELMLAAGICLVASEVAMVPAIRNRHKASPALPQAALMGMLLHLLIAAGLSVGVMLIGHPSFAFVWWLLAMFWLTLIVQCVVFVKVLHAPVKPTGTITN